MKVASYNATIALSQEKVNTFSQNIFNEVKQQVTARQAAELYGCQVNHAGFCLCVFHPDRHPSMKVDARFHCFACGADGDVIDLTAKLFALSPLEAARRLAEDFGIDTGGRPPTPQQQAEAAQRRAEAADRARFLQWRTDAANKLACAWRKCHELSQCDPDTLTEAQVMAVRLLPVVSFWLEDVLEGKDEAEQKWLYAERSTVAATLLKIGEAGDAP